MSETNIIGQVTTPLGRLTTGIIIGFGLMMLALLTPGILLLTFRMMDIDPDGYLNSYGLVAGIGAFFALIGNPIGGAVSDRTNVSFGRRRTWILFGALLGSAGLILVGFGTAIWQIIVGWSAAQFFFNFAMASYMALIPEQVKAEKQGTISGIIGLVGPAAASVGMVLMMVMTSVSADIKWSMLIILGLVGPVISLFLIKDGKVNIISAPKTKVNFIERVSRIYPSPRKFPSFSYAIIAKFFLMLGYGSASYLTVMLVSRMNYTQEEATQGLGVINIAMILAMALMSVVGGAWSDKVRKQKPFLYTSAAIMIMGILVFAFFPLFPAIVVAAIILGLGAGCFSAVDTALVARILPRKEDAAKDFGIMNVANTLPQSIVPALAPLIIGVVGWPSYFLTFGIFLIISMFCVKPLPEIGEFTDTNKATNEVN
ncbi:MFS transporter [Paenibacillus oralis]|uniref:MFS transporter n=1 Tax=Paenibacillus oralis TaxID=2490856 RepID=A0A3P3TZZ3_9BACL|nr:MFS transporter [Paenibacillus oralis]RRJ62848.1 MFS transporter [Paenibacillus oralis]